MLKVWIVKVESDPVTGISKVLLQGETDDTTGEVQIDLKLDVTTHTENVRVHMDNRGKITYTDLPSNPIDMTRLCK
jgi:hypothetical protein